MAMKHHKGTAKQPSIPSTASYAGLSSAVNRDYVLKILDKSTPEEIESILSRAGFRFPSEKRAARDQSAAFKREVESYLQGADGGHHRPRSIDDAVKQEAERWLASQPGHRELARLKTDLLAG